MPYISELLDNKVYDSSDANSGRLKDILISQDGKSFPALEYLEVKNPAGQLVYVPFSLVQNFNTSDITLKTVFSKAAVLKLPEDKTYIYLKDDVLDKQIVDVEGTRVVRVNDLRIGSVEDKICLLGIDASIRGLLRRLGLTQGFFSFVSLPFKTRLIDWRQAQLVGHGPLQLKTAATSLGQLHPADLANIVEDLDVKQASGILASLDEFEAAKVLEEIDTEWQSVLVKNLNPEKAGKIISQMSADEIADLVKTFSSDEAKGLLSKVQSGKVESVKELISYADNTAGGLMTSEFVSVRPGWTVERVIEEVKKQSEGLRSVLYVYVTDENGKFFGVVSLRRLMVASPEMSIKKIIKPLRSYMLLRPKDKIQKIIPIMTRYNLFTATVVDKNKKLVGIVSIDDVMRHLYPAA